jgi:hypothetical protein
MMPSTMLSISSSSGFFAFANSAAVSLAAMAFAALFPAS